MKYRLISKYLAAIWKPKEEKVWSTEVTDEKCNTLVKDEFGAIYSRYWKKLLSAPRSLSGEYSIRKGVKVIGNSAFSRCYFLTSINIPNSVTTIGKYAFYYCDSLTSINIPNSVTRIEDGAFENCENLPAHIKSDIIQRFGEKVFNF